MTRKVSVYTKAHAHSLMLYLEEAMHRSLDLPSLGKGEDSSLDIALLADVATAIGNANKALNHLLKTYYDVKQSSEAIHLLVQDTRDLDKRLNSQMVSGTKQQPLQ